MLKNHLLNFTVRRYIRMKTFFNIEDDVLIGFKDDHDYENEKYLDGLNYYHPTFILLSSDQKKMRFFSNGVVTSEI